LKEIEILNLITKKAELGISEKEIGVELNIKIRDVRTGTRKFYNEKLIFRNLSNNRWKLTKYRTSQEQQSNDRMEWTAN